MNESGRSEEQGLLDHAAAPGATAHDAAQEAADHAAVPPALPRRARAVPVDAPPVFERAVLEPLAPEHGDELVAAVGSPAAPAAPIAPAAPAAPPHRVEPVSAASVLADLTARRPTSPPPAEPPVAPPAPPSVQITTPVPLRVPPPTSPLPPAPVRPGPEAIAPIEAPVEATAAEAPVDEAPADEAGEIIDDTPANTADRTVPAPSVATDASAGEPPAARPVPTKARELPADETVPHTVIFKPRRATRTALTSVLVVWIAASVVSILAAWRAPSQPTIGIAGAIVLLTAVTWVARGGASVARLTVRGGMLEIRRTGDRATFSLSDSYQIIEVVGKPGSMGWKVLFRRKDVEPYVVDGSMVDPKAFMRVLTYYRPELAR